MNPPSRKIKAFDQSVRTRRVIPNADASARAGGHRVSGPTATQRHDLSVDFTVGHPL